MIFSNSNSLLYIEPKLSPEAEIDDDLSSQMAAMDDRNKCGTYNENTRSFTPRQHSLGIHKCRCGAESYSFAIDLGNGYYTNSLADHYLRSHRSEIPKHEMLKMYKCLISVCCSLQIWRENVKSLFWNGNTKFSIDIKRTFNC